MDRPAPLSEYLEAQGKYRHLSEAQVAHLQGWIDRNVAFVTRLASGAAHAQA